MPPEQSGRTIAWFTRAGIRRYAWHDQQPPVGWERHPVVLVSHADAEAYSAWLSIEIGQSWYLLSELEW